MTEQQLPDLITPVHPEDLYAAIRRAGFNIFGPESRKQILVVMAQSAFETGWWHYTHRWNLGNAKHVPGDGRYFTYFRCNEVIGGKVVWYDPPSPACCFRAYGSLDEGVADFLSLLHNRFALAWPAVLDGDPAEFCHQLKLQRYYTADEGIYTRGVIACFDQLSRLIPNPGDPVGITSDPVA